MTFETLQKRLPGVRQNVMLSPHTTFNIGGPAEYFFIARNEKDVVSAIKLAEELKLAVFVFGGGSNLLVSDEGMKGLVVKIQNDDEISMSGQHITASAGMQLGKLVDASIDASLAGLEWAGGLPGTFGGAIRGNAGAFGGEMKDSILSVHALDDHLELKEFSNEQCKFSYRSSIFKEKNWIIISATLDLKEGNKEALQQIADSRKNYRKEKHPLEYPSAGSIFKNIDVKKIPAEFQNEFSDKIKKDPFPIVPAAWFIIGAGLTGTQVGQAQISHKHSNYIVNLGGATAADVLTLIDVVKNKVKEKYGIMLEVEVQYVSN